MKNGNILSRSFHTGDSFEEADLEKKNITFIYENKGKYVFSEESNPGNRFEFTAEQLAGQARFLVPNTVVEGLIFEDEIINISVPIKMVFKIKDAPPGVKGDRSQGGNKSVTLETGTVMNVPLFIETGDSIEINTESGEYVRRIEKA